MPLQDSPTTEWTNRDSYEIAQFLVKAEQAELDDFLERNVSEIRALINSVLGLLFKNWISSKKHSKEIPNWQRRDFLDPDEVEAIQKTLKEERNDYNKLKDGLVQRDDLRLVLRKWKSSQSMYKKIFANYILNFLLKIQVKKNNSQRNTFDKKWK